MALLFGKLKARLPGGDGHAEATTEAITARAAADKIPSALDTPAFRSAWADWQAYRREKKLGPWIPRTTAAKLAECAAWGEAGAIDSIRASIGNGWAGLFPPKAGLSRHRLGTGPLSPQFDKF